MPIEIRELVIKVKVEEATKKSSELPDINRLTNLIEAVCKREIKTQLNQLKER